ncbi:DUF5610 domain-containing protein [Shewanella sp. AS16]|uniref:DUF5610 domain-containing protein n=1 Tax=Shewanella sp. AS16 TaxID=2907625 RepID=UPI001F45F34C|nr:DUF5610 domain-containing protein [Shewanella sp. AS16]MCE9685519.1 DUF5610 domain-containing protein [Shewanella sp. AS16]
MDIKPHNPGKPKTMPNTAVVSDDKKQPVKADNHGQTVSAAARDKTQDVGTHGQTVSAIANKKSAYQASQQLMNQAILSAQEEVSLSSGDNSMALLYRSAIEAINQELAAGQTDTGMSMSYEAPEDDTPAATAERIVNFATQFFPLHQQQHGDMSQDEQLESFMSVIGGAIEQGFGDARDILGGLKVLQGDIADGVDQTYDLVQQGLQAFRERLSPGDDAAAATPEA